jgi:alpha-galactosidase
MADLHNQGFPGRPRAAAADTVPKQREGSPMIHTDRYQSPSRFAVVALIAVLGIRASAGASEANVSAAWRDEVVAIRDLPDTSDATPVLYLTRQDYEQLELNRSVIQTPLRIGDRTFSRGLGTHSIGHIQIVSDDPITGFSAWVGVDHNDRTQMGGGSVSFLVMGDGRELHRTGMLRGGQPAQRIELALEGLRQLELHVGDGGDGPACDHANWADARVTTRSGKAYWLDEIPQRAPGPPRSPVPFSFIYDGQPSHEFVTSWPHDVRHQATSSGGWKESLYWTDPRTGLRVTCDLVRHADFPAVEWMLWFENTSDIDTPIIEDVNACDIVINSPLPSTERYRLYRTKGGVPDPTHFEVSTDHVDFAHPRRLTAGAGRSSSEDFPFFKVDAGRGSLVVAVGWSGCWQAELTCPDDRQLRLTAGLEKTHFRLQSGERVRSPRMLVLFHEGDSCDANARFRELIYAHYAARRDDQPVLPMLFCNTCFTRGGGWLNECTAENQISLIDAYAPLGLEALITDAGWFKGGWPGGAGNWTPREDAYPEGMGPVAAAAQAQGMVYGLWFEPERVMADTDLHRNHPDWLLRRQDGPDTTYLLNFGLPEVQEYFFDIVQGFMELPGFRFYRQDFNMDPLPYWRFSDAPDRQGISEMKYIEGLYAYWDRIATAWPDSIREECASGGYRIDLETVIRMHVHQKTDYWFDNEVDQASLWGVSQYLPNNTIVAHLCRLDDYSFHSTMASSLCLGWITDAPDFDLARAKHLTDRYLAVRHLLIGAWYPLLPYSRDRTDWTGMQYHRADLDEGMLLVFRRAESPYRAVDLTLRGLRSDATYELVSDGAGSLGTFTGAQLRTGLPITLPHRHASDLIVYRISP